MPLTTDITEGSVPALPSEKLALVAPGDVACQLKVPIVLAAVSPGKGIAATPCAFVETVIPPGWFATRNPAGSANVIGKPCTGAALSSVATTPIGKAYYESGCATCGV